MYWHITKLTCFKLSYKFRHILNYLHICTSLLYILWFFMFYLLLDAHHFATKYSYNCFCELFLFFNLCTDLFKWSWILLNICLSYCDFSFPINSCLSIYRRFFSYFFLGRFSIGPPQWLSGKESTCSAGDVGLIPGSGRSPDGGNGNPLQYSCQEKPMDREAGCWILLVFACLRNSLFFLF